MPDNRIRKIEAEAQRKAAIAKRATVLGKWLWLLFWLVIPSTIAGLMTHEAVAEALPVLHIPGQILTGVTSVGHCIILMKLAPEDARYRTAGICAIIGYGVSLAVNTFWGTEEAVTWTLILAVPAAIVSLVGEYNEFMAHANVLSGIDNALSEKWQTIWKWYIALFGVMLGSLLLMLLIPIVGALILLGGAIGVLIVGILKIVYLYRTAKLFREYQQQSHPENVK